MKTLSLAQVQNRRSHRATQPTQKQQQFYADQQRRKDLRYLKIEARRLIKEAFTGSPGPPHEMPLSTNKD